MLSAKNMKVAPQTNQKEKNTGVKQQKRQARTSEKKFLLLSQTACRRSLFDNVSGTTSIGNNSKPQPWGKYTLATPTFQLSFLEEEKKQAESKAN